MSATVPFEIGIFTFGELTRNAAEARAAILGSEWLRSCFWC